MWIELGIIVADWLAPVPWSHSSINFHPASTKFPGLPVLFVAAVTFPLALLWRWRRGPSSWPGVLLILAVGWLVLDLPWQWELATRLGEARARYALIPATQRPAHSHHALAHAVASAVRPQVEEQPGRIVISSSLDGLGMATAYYLYPLNTYWKRHDPALPAPDALHAGDYLLVLKPTRLRFDLLSRQLLDDDGAWPVQFILERSWGALYRMR